MALFQRENPDNDMNVPPYRNSRFRRKLERTVEENDLVLFNSHWMDIESAKQLYRRFELDSKLKVAEIIVVLVLLFFGAIMPFMMLGLRGGIAG